VPRFDGDDQRIQIVYKRPCETCTERGMAQDSYEDVMAYIRKKRAKCMRIRDLGVAKKKPDMVNAALNELALLDCLSKAARGWLNDKRKRGKYEKIH
jgi:hypothetical protein